MRQSIETCVSPRMCAFVAATDARPAAAARRPRAADPHAPARRAAGTPGPRSCASPKRPRRSQRRAAQG